MIIFGVYQSIKPQVKLEERLFSEAQEKIKKKEFKDAVILLEKVVSFVPTSQLGLESSSIGGQITFYETQEYKKALFFFRNIIRHSDNHEKIKAAQEKIAEIYYEKLSNYQQATLEFSRLLKLEAEEEKIQSIQQKIAKTYFYDANFLQTISEVDSFLLKWPESVKAFEMLSLKAQAQMSVKKLDDAIKTFDQIIKDHPYNEAIEEVYLSKAQCFEEKKEWDKAIQILKEIKSKYAQPEIIDMRIKSILRRKEKKKF
ncbi:MAG: tetratricopeptide repeat protein [Oligoflexia bacterium]|nr:tetratricopeptide repeat protein [Oligoflexia bacterium]